MGRPSKRDGWLAALWFALAVGIKATAAYVYLAVAIVSEVIATTALKSSDSFTRLGPSVVVVLGYGLAFYMLTLTLQVGAAYAIWSGVGIVLIALLGMIVHGERPDAAGWAGIGLIVLNVVSDTAAH